MCVCVCVCVCLCVSVCVCVYKGLIMTRKLLLLSIGKR